ncbi:MAG: hypothetical protein IK078_00820 [Lachnospiraceae bacterium]|nr:hypothetical protein [Lachnospiraceae bacterium]
MRDHWLDLKYLMSGLKLLAELAADNPQNRGSVLNLWFCDTYEDPLIKELYDIAADGIRTGNAIQELMDDMISLIPRPEICKPDSKGYTFLPRNPEKLAEWIYDEKCHRNRLCAVYEGLIPGMDHCGLSFADLAYRDSSTGSIHLLENAVENGSMKAWEQILSSVDDEDLALLAAGMSQNGRHFLLAGLFDGRYPAVIEKSVLYGPDIPTDAYDVADRILEEFTRNTHR